MPKDSTKFSCLPHKVLDRQLRLAFPLETTTSKSWVIRLDQADRCNIAFEAYSRLDDNDWADEPNTIQTPYFSEQSLI